MNKIQTSGLSLAINTTMASLAKGRAILDKKEDFEVTVKVANTLEERQGAFALAYQVYLSKGFICSNPHEMLIHHYDSIDDTVILIVQDKQKNIVGTVSIVFDGNSKLPAEKIYRDELKVLRDAGTKMAELSRLVISSDYRNSKEILLLLFNYATIYIRQVKHYNSLSIQVNPRHKNYYKSILNFDEVGGLKPCPQVQNAPAVLLYITEKKYQAEMARQSTTSPLDNKDHSLYRYFLNAAQEKLVAYYLKKQAKPMSAEEKLYFGFTSSGFGKAVAV